MDWKPFIFLVSAPLLENCSFFPLFRFCRFHDPSPCVGNRQDILLVAITQIETQKPYRGDGLRASYARMGVFRPAYGCRNRGENSHMASTPAHPRTALCWLFRVMAPAKDLRRPMPSRYR